MTHSRRTHVRCIWFSVRLAWTACHARNAIPCHMHTHMHPHEHERSLIHDTREIHMRLMWIARHARQMRKEKRKKTNSLKTVPNDLALSWSRTRGFGESEGVAGFQEGSLGIVDQCRPHARAHAHAHTNTHAYTKTRWSYSLFLHRDKHELTKKNPHGLSQTLSLCCTIYVTTIYVHHHMIKFFIVSLYLHTYVPGFLPVFSSNCILTYRNFNLFQDVFTGTVAGVL